MGGAAARNERGPGSRRSFSARARQAAFLQAHGHSRKETAEIVGVAPETISVWEAPPAMAVEVERWRELAEAPLDRKLRRRSPRSLSEIASNSSQLAAAPPGSGRPAARSANAKGSRRDQSSPPPQAALAYALQNVSSTSASYSHANRPAEPKTPSTAPKMHRPNVTRRESENLADLRHVR